MKGVIEYRMKNGLCAFCGEKGHKANGCPKKTTTQKFSVTRPYSPHPRTPRSRRDGQKSGSDSSKKTSFVKTVEASEVTPEEMQEYIQQLPSEERHQYGFDSNSSEDSQH